jgi:hypothetical protein
MTSTPIRQELTERIRTRQSADLRACFPDLCERDLMLLLTARPPQAVYILQQSFDCAMEDAKAAWNDYVLRYVDGQPQWEDEERRH